MRRPYGPDPVAVSVLGCVGGGLRVVDFRTRVRNKCVPFFEMHSLPAELRICFFVLLWEIRSVVTPAHIFVIHSHSFEM